jgi:hypothetical protein
MERRRSDWVWNSDVQSSQIRGVHLNKYYLRRKRHEEREKKYIIFLDFVWHAYEEEDIDIKK